MKGNSVVVVDITTPFVFHGGNFKEKGKCYTDMKG